MLADSDKIFDDTQSIEVLTTLEFIIALAIAFDSVDDSCMQQIATVEGRELCHRC